MKSRGQCFRVVILAYSTMLSAAIVGVLDAGASARHSPKRLQVLVERNLDADANHDGSLTEEEWQAYRTAHRDQALKQLQADLRNGGKAKGVKLRRKSSSLSPKVRK